MKLYLQAFITIIALINPVICGAMFLASEQGRTVPVRLMDASKAAFSILVILVVTALLGIRVLDAFGISLDVFSMAGGGVLVWMGSKMIRAATAPSSQPSSLTSLVVFAASPGTIAGVIAIAQQSLAHAETFEAFEQSFTGRIYAMARVHEALACSLYGGLKNEARQQEQCIRATRPRQRGTDLLGGHDLDGSGSVPVTTDQPLFFKMNEVLVNR